jgi:hypothetical protein
MLFMQLFAYGSAGNNEKKVKKCVLSNGVDVILYEDFSMPAVIVGIIFHTGSFDAPKHQKMITSLIAQNFISDITHTRLLNSGISYKVNVHGFYTEIVAVMNPKHINKFFQTICDNEFIVKNFDLLKKRQLICEQLARSCHQNDISDKISTEIRYKNSDINNVFNESAFFSIKLQDVENYFERYYKKCHLSVVVSGAVGYKNLIKVMQSSVCNLPPRDSVSNDLCENNMSKDVCIENKYVGRSVRYFYKISKEDLAAENSFFSVLNNELFGFFKKSGAAISDYCIVDEINSGDCVRQIVFYPKPDVSLEDFQRAYKIFTDRICAREITSDVFEKVKLTKSYLQQFLRTDLYSVYAKIKNDHLKKIDEETEIVDSKQFNSFCDKFFKQNLILKIITKYKPDK